MARFSLGGDDDGEGPSSPRPKRLRISVQTNAVAGDNQEQEGEHCVNDGERQTNEEDEEDEEDEEESEEEEESCEDEDDDEEDNEEEEEDLGSSLSVGHRSNGGAQVSRDGSISVTLTDPEVLDCSICYEPLSSPVYQCENGHIACASCCIKLRHKCPSCFWPIGYNRCRSIEKVLESVKISCPNAKYGCKEAVCYSKKNDHEKTCMYAPCSCPLSECDFIASSKQLYIHFSRKHPISAICFLYDSVFSVSLNVKDKFLVLQEQNNGVLFILNNSVEVLGNSVTVSCIGPCSSTGGFPYILLAKIHGSALRLKSFTKNSQDLVDKPSSMGFLLIPKDFFGSCGQLKLEVCIQGNAASASAYARRRRDPV